MRRITALAAVLIMSASLASTASARELPAWSPATNLSAVLGTSPQLNTPALEGCPAEAPDGRELYFASNRPGGSGGLDIWIARRAGDAAWGPPENPGAPLNSPANDFCPSPLRGNRLFFVSDRPSECGDQPGRGADIYVSRRHPVRGFGEPRNIGCHVNSAAGEASPYYLEDETGRAWLYFSSGRPSALGGSNLYVSTVGADGTFGAPEPVLGVNSAFDDARPYLRRDGLELVFDSNRPGGLGGFDVYAATRASLDDAWSSPVSLGDAVNSAANEMRPSLSWDGTRLYFGSNRPGSAPTAAGEPSMDLYVSDRHPLRACLRGHGRRFRRFESHDCDYAVHGVFPQPWPPPISLRCD